jgi:alanyl-tRNA synthetase
MQPLKRRFQFPDLSSYGNIQYCVRTNDIDEVGDGTHLTFFQMVGSFGFGTNKYEEHCELWTSIVRDLELPIDHVDVHPESPHRGMWERRNFRVSDNPTCVWTDGNVGGYCSELFTPSGLEVGNLVNPMTFSIDVGFGYERILQVMEGKSRVDETELFNQFLDPVSRDHYRTLSVFRDQNIVPGNKGRNYVCRRLIRRVIRLNPQGFECPFTDWMDDERSRMDKSIRDGRKHFRRNQRKVGTLPDNFYWETFGVLPEEMELLKS